MQTNTFWLKFGGVRLTVTLKIRSRSPKPIQLFIISKCYIHANLVKICQPGTQAPFGSNLNVWVLQWPWKIDQGHENLFSSSSCPNVISMQIWLKSANQFMRYGAPSTFWLKFGSLSPTVTLKIRSKSLKWNQFFIMSHCYIHANLVKIHPLVHELSCKQESVTPTATGSAPKTICSPPLWWGT